MKIFSIYFLIYLLLLFMSVGCGSENKVSVTEPKEVIKNTVPVPVVVTSSDSHHAYFEQEGDSIGILNEDASFTIGDKVFHLEYCTLAELMSEKPYKDTLEEDYLRRDASLVKRVDKSLLFTLKNSQKVAIVDKGDDTDELEHYVYKGRLKEIGQYIVHVHYYEGDGYLAVNESSGEMVHVIDQLIVSPSKKHAIAGNCDLQAGYTFNGIELYEIQNNSLVLIGKKELKGWGPKRLYWTNDSTLVGEKDVFDGSSPGLESTERLKLILRAK